MSEQMAQFSIAYMSDAFCPFRLLILLGIAFIAGSLYERGEIKARCKHVGDDIESGFCER